MSYSTPSVVPFTPTGDKFDTTTFGGRFQKLFSQMNPMGMFWGESEVATARETLNKYTPGTQYTDAENQAFWEAKNVLDVAVHPQTGELLNPVCRMAAFVPTNVPICMGMLFSAPTITNQIVWQWINQTYNAAFNYANGNKSGGGAQDDVIVKSYLAATSISVGLSVGLNRALKAAKLAPGPLKVASILVPWAAVASAGYANVVMMRSSEKEVGVAITTEAGEPLGSSKAAAAHVLHTVGMSRVALACPILLLPPVLMGGIRAAMTLSPAGLKVAETAVLAACLGVAFPAALALSPARIEIPHEILEAEIAKSVNPAVKVFADKGM